jgi:hypothetical protein
MEIKLPVKIHNKFEVEVKDIITGEIVQKAYAENIILNSFFTNGHFATSDINQVFGRMIVIGRGTGVLSPSRTTLFNTIGMLTAGGVEYVANQVPLPSYATKRIVISPESYVGETITEVGIGQGNSGVLLTHALLKDSEGNQIALGPKTDNQEISIYATVYFQPNFEEGITLWGSLGVTATENGNAILMSCMMYGPSNLKNTTSTYLYVNGANQNKSWAWSSYSNGVLTMPVFRRTTAENNDTKIKIIAFGSTYAIGTRPSSSIRVDLETLAENNSTIWSGYSFTNRQIGVGDGTTTVFNLTWDEVWDSKPKAVFVDGVEVTSGVTWTSGSIIFDTAPTDQSIITADYWVKYIPKDSDHVLDISFTLVMSEGA